MNSVSTENTESTKHRISMKPVIGAVGTYPWYNDHLNCRVELPAGPTWDPSHHTNGGYCAACNKEEQI